MNIVCGVLRFVGLVLLGMGLTFLLLWLVPLLLAHLTSYERMEKRKIRVDDTQYNGWPNVFTWHVYCHLSSYEDTYDTARALVAHSSSVFVGAERLQEWVQEVLDEWFDVAPEQNLKTLYHDLVNVGLRQVHWERLAVAFQEGS